MYHTHLLINVGENPDRPDWSIGRKWLRNLYRVHQRLCMAFPSKPVEAAERPAVYCRSHADADAPLERELEGEAEDHGPPPCVHAARSGRSGFLFRIDHPPDPLGQPGRRPVIVVQSNGDEPPDWDYAFGLTRRDNRSAPYGNAGHLLAAHPQVRRVCAEVDGKSLVLHSPSDHFELRAGDRVRFRLRANPTRKVNGRRKRLDPRPETMASAHADWLVRKLGDAVRTPICLHGLVPGWAYGWRTKHEPQPSKRMQFWSVLFEGVFIVEDTSALRDLMLSGIGPAKAFGFGLLSVAPV